jgi:hypothetical protein
VPGYSKFIINTWYIQCGPLAIVVDRLSKQDVAMIDCWLYDDNDVPSQMALDVSRSVLRINGPWITIEGKTRG